MAKDALLGSRVEVVLSSFVKLDVDTESDGFNGVIDGPYAACGFKEPTV